jgi:hypothetical protein
MAVKKLTFNGENNTAEQASKIHLALQSSPCGVLEGIGSECAYTFANNKITFKSGLVSVYGRMVEIEESTEVRLEPDGHLYGYLVLYVSTHDDTVLLQLKESASLPSLQQDNLSVSPGVFEMPLVKYQKTLTAVSILQNTEELLVKNIETIKSETVEELKYHFESVGTREVTRTDHLNASHYFNLSLNETGKVLLMMTINDVTDRVFSSNIISLGPGTGIHYILNGTSYLAELVRYDTRIVITTASSSHEVTGLWVIK